MVLTLVAVLATPMTVLAGNPTTGTTLVSGQIALTYTITPPDPVNLGTFTTATDYAANGKTITVSTNDPNMHNCGITVKDAKPTTTGYLTLGGADDASKKLTSPLNVAGGDISSYNPLTSEQTLRAAGTSIESVNINNFAVKQTINSADLLKTPGTYNLTMTFTATFST